MEIPKRITVRMLRLMGACEDGVNDFRRVFGDSAAFVPGNVYVAADDSLGSLLWWFMEQAFPDAYLESNEMYGVALAERPGRRCASPKWFRASALCRLARQNLKPKRGLTP